MYGFLDTLRNYAAKSVWNLATRHVWCLQMVGISYTLFDMQTTTEAIAAKVRGVAAERRYTQKRIADTLRISRTSVVERVNGRIPFTGPELFDLARSMRVSPARFFPDEAEVASNEPSVDLATAS